ncbi:MAG TPA: alkaline phosphatase family protein [Candidatus Limnocylindrales bacterium]|nr:alkaline phosphatase family protein [Candidatus Limnocylindrales bacterium]
MTRVVLLGLDGFPHRAIRPDWTPRMWRLGQDGGRAPEGGLTGKPSSTYPGFCTLLTGRMPQAHGVRTTGSQEGVLPAWAGTWTRVRVPTLFDACRTAGLRSVAVQGDHLMHPMLGTDACAWIWPPGGQPPPGTPLDEHGYPVNAAVRPPLLEAARERSLAFLFGHLNEADTIGHDTGPESGAARRCYQETDAIVGEVLDALQPDWGSTMVVIVSDHDMEARTDRVPIDLLADAEVRQVAQDVVADGGAALLQLRSGVSPEAAGQAVTAVPGVAGWSDGRDGMIIVDAQPGWIFDAWRLRFRGYHGGPATARTVALVGGGHPDVPVVAAAIRTRRPHLADWAPTIARVLDLRLQPLDGSALG